MSTRSGRPGPSRCSWPTTSSSGAGPQPGRERRPAARAARATAALKRSSATRRCYGPRPGRRIPASARRPALSEIFCGRVSTFGPLGVFSRERGAGGSAHRGRRCSACRCRGDGRAHGRARPSIPRSSIDLVVRRGLRGPLHAAPTASRTSCSAPQRGRGRRPGDPGPGLRALAQGPGLRRGVGRAGRRQPGDRHLARAAGRRRRSTDAPRSRPTPGPDAQRVDLHRALDRCRSASARSSCCASSPTSPRPTSPRRSGARSDR